MSCSSVSRLPRFDAPLASQLEVVLIGPRYGEAICVHLGSNRWLMVDSCLYEGSVAPLHYLNQIGVDASAIEMIVATHWHDDHVRGLSEVADAASDAVCVVPLALNSKEFITLASAYSGRDALAKGVSELYRVLYQTDVARLRFAAASQLLLSTTTEAGPVNVWALSPSSEECRRALVAVGSMLPREGAPIGHPPARRPNHLAMALLITVGDTALILGADLEEVGDPLVGWRKVLTEPVAQNIAATLFKVPHHGSDTAYYAPVWQSILTANPVAIVTPFERGKSKLPTADGIAQLKGHTPHLFVTSPRVLTRPPRLSSIVSDDVAARTKDGLRTVARRPGIVRCRRHPGDRSGAWEVGLYDGAAQL
ncbi:hypothetical protein Psesu_0680 [Pseudoxanthomonas suwonensis 11-1]|uniref:Metallo-beta-lactamase domain-containing protein n=1 Tax=Pseudoxanthomonas suwonensis (strain 11-1) TaxID=743721 RepID=E6WQT6_PSEUU|nr:MBL fold metallo-hydrolase [Pseudoxanthomonas suwonensis]ADV26535.1 hypothetical protein Psesu_0680 [Pseudoxanthomonas suwonensis 11-1]